MESSEVILSLGSNQGDRLGWLKRAGLELLALPDTRAVAFSPVYETDPVGVPRAYQGVPYLNSVAILETRLPPDAFSRAVHAIEDRFGRVRGDTPGLPRVIDIDIVLFGRLTRDAPELTLPHPRVRERRFVLQPLADLRPGLTFPGDTRTVAQLLAALPDAPRAWRFPGDSAPAPQALPRPPAGLSD